jgi:pimeloyl-ACP methyl ester carboxylesterase
MTTVATAALAAAAASVERTLVCSDGVKLAVRQWRSSNVETTGTAGRIMCLHGWLDNCSSFDLVAPALSQRFPSHDIVALDFPGHGLSSHKSADAPPQLLAEYAFYVAEAVHCLEWSQSSLIVVGHSMGAGVGVAYAASFPERVSSLVLLEGAGPLARPARDCSKHIRAAIDRRLSYNRVLYPNGHEESKKTARVYPSMDVAVNTRRTTARLSPGKQSLSHEAAHALVERSTISTPTVEHPQGVSFRHDPRLQWPSLQYLTHEQVEALWKDIQCPTCLLLATNGWPFDTKSFDICKTLLQPTHFETLDGSHHFHRDPETAGPVIDQVVAFLDNEINNNAAYQEGKPCSN